MVDGVAHINNPEKPLGGEVILDIEKTLEINPYQYEEVGLRSFSFIRDADGEVILSVRMSLKRHTNMNTSGRLFNRASQKHL